MANGNEISSELSIKERLLKIIGFGACWLDGEECPFGRPRGRFANRPRLFCNMNMCQKLARAKEDLREIFGDYFEEIIEDRIAELFDQEGTTLSSMLKTIAREKFEEDDQKREILILAAEILEAESEGSEEGEETRTVNPLVLK
jgi:hypothetical protein